MVNSLNQIRHTEEIKKENPELEREIKSECNQIKLLNNLATKQKFSRGLTINDDFSIRELKEDENGKFLSNLATIKKPTLHTTQKNIQDQLLDMVDRSIINNPNLQNAYKKGILDFFDDISNVKISFLRTYPLYRAYLHQYHYKYKSKENSAVGEFNIRSQVAKVLLAKFGDEAFELIKEGKQQEIIRFSQKSLDYIHRAFYNANKVWERWDKKVNQVYHDGDFMFIMDGDRGTEEEYVDVFYFLLDRNKHNPYGKGGEKGKIEWAKKTSQYADVLWALSNDQLGLAELTQKEFEWDQVYQNLYTIGGGHLQNTVDAHNKFKGKDFKLSKRLKGLPSCVEKIIEGKKINDVVGFRLSMENISSDNFEDVKEISIGWLKSFVASMESHPEKYVQPGETIQIKQLTIDNKGVLMQEQLKQLKNELAELNLPVYQRDKPSSPYVSTESWRKKIEKNYPEDMKDTENREALSAFYELFSSGKARGSNGGYKDFKYNLVFEVRDELGNSKVEKTMEVQFDDVNNAEGMANFNIRNCERTVNTQSRLSFDVPLKQVRSIIEYNLKRMQKWAKDKDPKFSIITFSDGTTIDISSFQKRTYQNTMEIDKCIIYIINYFLEKGTFLLYVKDQDQLPYLENGLLNCKNLSSDEIEKIHICTNLELATQQHAYLQDKWNDQIGIYLPEKNKIGRMKMGALTDRVNLGKKKSKESQN